MLLYISAMKRYCQYEPVVIEDFEAAEWHHPVHRHNHYELIYIKGGTGVHFIHEVSHPYGEHQVFLLGPEDDHYFEIHERTRFVYLKFTDLYLHRSPVVTNPGLQKLEYLLKSREAHFSAFKLSAGDRHTLDQLFNVVVSLKEHTLCNQELIWLQVLSIAAVLQRNRPELSPATPASRTKDMQAVFAYLHTHIYTPEKLRAPILASHFNTTAEYIGPYFKRNTGLTLRKYIREYRKALIHQRLASGRYSLKEIATEFGLTDESHVSKVIY
jgi:AraC family L-rhamnose operon regulatory protein RhaS